MNNNDTLDKEICLKELDWFKDIIYHGVNTLSRPKPIGANNGTYDNFLEVRIILQLFSISKNNRR